MKKVCVVGHFGFGKELLNGQTIKAKAVTAELERQLGSEQVKKIDTHGGMRALPRVLRQLFGAFCHCENIVILPAHNGIRVFAPLCAALCRMFHRKLHYVVIGGWLADYLHSHRRVAKALHRFTGIYVETSTMQRALEALGYQNVFLMPNFKNLQILSENELISSEKEPHRLCTFSRVMKEKGIEDAVNAVNSINEKYGRTVFALDIYGQVDSEQTQWFEELKASFPVYIHYRGLVPFDQSVSVLKDYFALLFPTKFYTEGIPGTILDAYCAGIPVISARWESFADVVDNGITGIGYEFGNQEALLQVLHRIAQKPNEITDMKRNCIAAAGRYLPANALQVILREM